MKVNDAVHDAGLDPKNLANSCLNDGVHDGGSNRMELAKKCLLLISDIAGRCARSPRPEAVAYAMQELSQVLFERSGSEEILFEPMEVDQTSNLGALLEELDLVDGASREMSATPPNI